MRHALEVAGYAPAAFDLTPAIQPDRAVLAPPDGPKDDTRGPLILHVNPPELPRALLALRHANLNQRRLAGFWAWEMATAPPSWRGAERLVHAVWAPSAFTAGAFRRLSLVKPIRAAGYPLIAPHVRDKDITRWRQRADAAGPEHFLVVAAADVRSSLTRKNIAGVVSAFQRAFPDAHARLVIKLTGGGAAPVTDPAALGLMPVQAPRDPRIQLVAREGDHREAAALWAAADVVFSPHRGEGFGLTLAEALLLGTPVIMTGWSGNAEFAACPGAVTLPARFTPVEDAHNVYAEGGQVWAEPDLDAGAEALRRVRALSAEARADMGERSRAYMAYAFSAGRFLARLDADTLAAMTHAEDGRRLDARA